MREHLTAEADSEDRYVGLNTGSEIFRFAFDRLGVVTPVDRPGRAETNDKVVSPGPRQCCCDVFSPRTLDSGADGQQVITDVTEVGFVCIGYHQDAHAGHPPLATGHDGTVPSSISLTGQLLVATPLLDDPNFRRTVVLLLDHDEGGALGVVLNRPSPVPVDEVLPGWALAASEPGVLFQGGPVALDSAVGVASVRGEEPLGWRRVHGSLGVLDLDGAPEDLGTSLGGVRIFAGYAGWSPEQLEDELNEGAWYVVQAMPTDVFDAQPEQLWRSVLRRQSGDLALVATFPEDPTLN